MLRNPPSIAEPRLLRAQRRLEAERRRAPSTGANCARNAGAELGRHRRWAAARDAAWWVIDRSLRNGATVAIVGAGNGDTLPLPRIAARASAVTLIDVDRRALARARRRVPLRDRGRVELLAHDITFGAADAIAIAAAAGRVSRAPAARPEPLPGAPYDLVIGDLFYSQLLFPALSDLAVAPARVDAVLEACGPALTLAVVSRLQASAPRGRAIHLHDPLAWWPGHSQPVSLPAILAVADQDPAAAMALVARASGPRGCDPRTALAALGVEIAATVLWPWPFSDGVDYLVVATVAGNPSPAAVVGST